MPYTKQTWVNFPDNTTPVSAARLTHMEDGIFGANTVHNVKAYGATGDGVTDDAAAIQAALTAVGTTGGVVYLPEGTYIIGTPLVVPSWTPFTMKGSGWKTILKAKASANLSAVIGDGTTTSRVWQSLFQDFAIDGNVTNGNASVKGMYICGHSSFVHRVWAYNCYDGIDVGRIPTDPSNYYGANVVTNSIASECDHKGFSIPVDTLIQGCGVGEIGVRVGYSEAYETCGIYVGSWDCRVINNHIWGVNGPCIWSQWVEHLIVSNNIMERTYGPYILLSGRAYLINITGNVFEDKTADGSHEALDWTGVPFIKYDVVAGQKQGALITGNMFSEISGKARGYCISESTDADYGYYRDNWAAIAGSSAFANIVGANSVAGNNLVRGLA